VWKVSSDQNVARFGAQAIAHPARRIVGLQIVRRSKLGKRVARPPERLGGLTRAQLAAVPDDRRSRTSSGGLCRETLDLSSSHSGEGALRINVRTDSVTVMNQVEVH
jgi:hypothetical protein